VCHQDVTFLGLWLNSVHDDVLEDHIINTATAIGSLAEVTNIIFPVNMTLAISIEDHFGVKVIKDPFDVANAIMFATLRYFILAAFADKVEKLRIQIVEPFDRTDSRMGEGCKGSG
jgi:hypothetical protein